jgi:hypothetical protein
MTTDGELVLLVFSDAHYASAAEKAKGEREYEVILSAPLRLFVKCFRRFIWLRQPHAHNHLLDRFLAIAGEPDLVVGNGDYSCDSGFVGVVNEAAYISVREVFDKLHSRFPGRFQANYGDHELGKMSLFGGQGGPRLASWERSQAELGMRPFWRLTLGNYCLIGVTSSLVALPVYEPETLPEELETWRRLREHHLGEIEQAFRELRPNQQAILFCHDPTALPWLWRLPEIRAKACQLEMTWIGHLHSPLFLWKSRLLAGMPTISFLGNSIRRMSAALHEARCWKNFNVRLCPSLAGTQLLKDGGFFEIRLQPSAQKPPRVIWHPLPWK